jgi:hypothetical protein
MTDHPFSSGAYQYEREKFTVALAVSLIEIFMRPGCGGPTRRAISAVASNLRRAGERNPDLDYNSALALIGLTRDDHALAFRWAEVQLNQFGAWRPIAWNDVESRGG